MEDTLIHYGVKGMKWGVIRNRDKSSGKSSGSSGRPPSSKVAVNQAKKSTSTKKSTMREKIARGKDSVDHFLSTPAGKAVKVAAVLGLSYVGMGAVVSAANFIAFGQSPLTTLGLDGFDSLYTEGFSMSRSKLL